MIFHSDGYLFNVQYTVRDLLPTPLKVKSKKLRILVSSVFNYLNNVKLEGMGLFFSLEAVSSHFINLNYLMYLSYLPLCKIFLSIWEGVLF